MQLILKKDVQNLGEVGDLVTVKDGYARNFLLPNNLAQVATKGALDARERDLARIKSKAEKLHNEALTQAEKIEAIKTLNLSAKAGESGKLFGTITTKKLAEELLAQAGVEVDRKLITLDNPINKVGEYQMTIKLTSKVKAVLAVAVVASETLKESIVEEEEEEVVAPKAPKAEKAAKVEEVVEEVAEVEAVAEEVVEVPVEAVAEVEAVVKEAEEATEE